MNQDRVFLAVRINPSERDNKVFLDGCVTMGATCYGYSVVPQKTKVVFEGFLMLGAGRPHDGIERQFPNFLLTEVRI